MIIKRDKDIILSYFSDHSWLPCGNADAVYFPENTDDVCAILKECNINKTSVTISGAGTGVLGGRIPYGGVVISTEKLNKLRELNKKEKTISVQAGVTLEEMNIKLWEQGYFFPPNPTEQSATIGGVIANNSSGSRSFKYGSIRNYIDELTIVLPSGEKVVIKRGEYKADEDDCFDVQLASKRRKIKLPSYYSPGVKNTAGLFVKKEMDLIDLFIGSEGILGIICEARLKLLKKPEKMMAGFIFFKDKEECLELVQHIKAVSKKVRDFGDEGDIDPMSLEYFDVNSLALLKEQFPTIPDYAKACIFFEQGFNKQDEEILLLAWTRLIEGNEIPLEDTWFADNDRDILYYNEIRHALPVRLNELISQSGFRKISADIAVPGINFSDMLDFYEDILLDSELKFVIFGHIGDNHLHVNIIPSTEDEFNKALIFYDRFIDKALELEGTISAEHGIGKLKKSYLEKMIKQQGLAQIKAVKKIFDPEMILNPGDMI